MSNSDTPTPESDLEILAHELECDPGYPFALMGGPNGPYPEVLGRLRKLVKSVAAYEQAGMEVNGMKVVPLWKMEQLETELAAAKRELEELQGKLATASVCELGASNLNVASYMAHWEMRATKAESSNRELREALQTIKEESLHATVIGQPTTAGHLMAVLVGIASTSSAALATTTKG